MVLGTHESHFLTWEQVDGIFTFIDTLCAHGRCPNVHITIDIQDIVEGQIRSDHFRPQTWLSSFLNKMQRWHKKHGISFGYVWVAENVASTGKHIHILLHSDPEHRDILDEKITQWFPERDDHNPNAERTNINIQHFYDEQSLENLSSYICKGLDPDQTHPRIQKTHRKKRYQGHIIGKRTAHSQL